MLGAGLAADSNNNPYRIERVPQGPLPKGGRVVETANIGNYILGNFAMTVRKKGSRSRILLWLSREKAEEIGLPGKATGYQFVLVPLSSVEVARRVKESRSEWHFKLWEGEGIAAGSAVGIGYGGENQDRFQVCGNRVIVLDGVGGHENGTRAAEIARAVGQRGTETGSGLGAVVTLMDEAIWNDSVAKGLARSEESPGATVLAYEVVSRGEEGWTVRFVSVGDAEAVAIRLGDSVRPHQFPFWTARPIWSKAKGIIRLTGDGLVVPEDLHLLRLDTESHMIDEALGWHQSGSGKPHAPEPVPVTLARGTILLSGSDGLFEVFRDYNEIADLILASGAKTAAEIRDLLLTEALIRQRLCRMMFEAKGPIELTRWRYVRAYREITGKAPPRGWKGKYEGLWIDINGYVGEKKDLVSSGKESGKFALDKTTGLPKALVRFKPDNVTLVVQIVG